MRRSRNSSRLLTRFHRPTREARRHGEARGKPAAPITGSPTRHWFGIGQRLVRLTSGKGRNAPVTTNTTPSERPYVYPALVDTGLLCECHSFVGDGALVAESALAALGVVEGLDVVEEDGP